MGIRSHQMKNVNFFENGSLYIAKLPSSPREYSRVYLRDIVKREGDLVSVVLVDIDTGFEFCGSIPPDCVFECPDQLARIPRLAIHLVQAYIKPIDSNMSYWPSDVTLQVKKQIYQQIIKIEIESKDNRIDGIPCP